MNFITFLSTFNLNFNLSSFRSGQSLPSHQTHQISEPAENHNQSACVDHETASPSKVEMHPQNLRRKKPTPIGTPDQPPDDHRRGSGRGYRPNGGWSTIPDDHHEPHSNSSFKASPHFEIKGHLQPNAPLPSFKRKTDTVSKNGPSMIFNSAIGSINPNKNAKLSNARTKDPHPRQGPSGLQEHQQGLSIRGRGKGKQKANNGVVDLTQDDDPIESFSDQGDSCPATNLHIAEKPIQSSSKDNTDDPMLLRSKHNQRLVIKGPRKSLAEPDHIVERQHMSPRNQATTQFFALERVHISVKDGLATLPFPDACYSSRLMVDKGCITFQGDIPSHFEMEFRAAEVETVFIQAPTKRQKFALQLKDTFRWRQGRSICALEKLPQGWALPVDSHKLNPAPPRIIFFELKSRDYRASTVILTSLFDILDNLPRNSSAAVSESLDSLWPSWLPSDKQWQKPAEPSLGLLPNTQSLQDDQITQIPDSDEIEIQPQGRPDSRVPNNPKFHVPSTNDINIRKKSKATADISPASEPERHDVPAKDKSTSIHSPRDQPESHGPEVKDTGILPDSSRDSLMHARRPSKSTCTVLNKPKPPSKGPSRPVFDRPKSPIQSVLHFTSSTEATKTPGPNVRVTRSKANTPAATYAKLSAHNRVIEPPKATGKRTHNSVTGAASDPQQTTDTDIVLVWPYMGEKNTNSVAITHSDMRRLEEGEFLNDTLIEFGLKWEMENIRERNPRLSESIYMFNSFFFQKLNKKSKKKLDVTEESKIAYEGVRKWTKGHDLFTKDFVVIPINEHMHWYFMIVANPGKILDVKPSATPPNRATRSRSSIASMPEADPVTLAVPADEEDQLEDSPHFPKQEEVPRVDDQPPMDLDDPTVALGQMNLENKEDQDMLVADQNDNSTPCILTLDSLSTGSHKAQAKTILRYFVNEANAKKSGGLPYSIVENIAITKVSVPEQPNFCDCGLYLIHAFKMFFQNTNNMMTWIRENSSRKKKSEDLDWMTEVRNTWDADAAQTARQEMKLMINECIPGYKKHLEETKNKKSKERASKDLSASDATQPKDGYEGLPPKGLVSARRDQYEILSSTQPDSSRRPSSSGMDVEALDADVQFVDPPIKLNTPARLPLEQSHTPLCKLTANSPAIKHGELSPKRKRRRVVDDLDDEDSRVQTIQMSRHDKRQSCGVDRWCPSQKLKQAGDTSMSEASDSPGEGAQTRNEATRIPTGHCDFALTLTPTSGLSEPIDPDQKRVAVCPDIDGVPLESVDLSPSSLQNKFESPSALQNNIEDHPMATTPKPNQALSGSPQSRSLTRKASYQHQNSLETASASPVVPDAERTRPDKQRRDPSTAYKVARARDEQQAPSAIFNRLEQPSGAGGLPPNSGGPNNPISLD